jgi:hypothetical protein
MPITLEQPVESYIHSKNIDVFQTDLLAQISQNVNDGLKTLLNSTESSSTVFQIDQFATQGCDEKSKSTSSDKLTYVDRLEVLAECATSMECDSKLIARYAPYISPRNVSVGAMPIGHGVSRYAPYVSPRNESVGAIPIGHGVSRYAPYGTRFGATMPNGTFKMSHAAGDLSERKGSKDGRGRRSELGIFYAHKSACRTWW